MTAVRDGWYRAVIGDMDEGRLEFVFTNGSGQWDNNGGRNYVSSGPVIAVENGQVANENPLVIPVESIAITGDGLSDGALTLEAGGTAQLTAVISPEDATDASAAWSSSDQSVARVSGLGVVNALGAGTAVITAEAGGLSASITLTVTERAAEDRPTTVWYRPDESWKSVSANYRVYADKEFARHDVELEKVCGGWYRLVIPDANGAKVSIAFTDGKRWDLDGSSNYMAAGDSIAVADGELLTDVTPNCAVEQ